MTDHNEPAASTPLELDLELRLHPQQLNLGKAELLTDALILPFTDIESRLGHYALGASEQEKAGLRKSMKAYLGRLNANPHLPLKFRLKVLNRFEQELNLFDAEMTAAVLNAHKIAVALVQQLARSDRSYYTNLIEMIANAVELSVKLLLINLGRYRGPAVIVTRQFFDLARLGLDVAAAMGAQAPSKIARLNKALCNHEMLRRIDFFAKTEAQQKIIWQELQHHIDSLTPCLCHKKTLPASVASDMICMLTNLNRPNDPPRIVEKFNTTADYDYIIIPLHAFIARLEKGIRSVESVLHNQQMQKKTLHTETALESTMLGGTAILSALKSAPRHLKRLPQAKIRIVLGADVGKSIIKTFSLNPTGIDSSVSPDKFSTGTFDQRKTWNLVDFNHHGICLERMHGTVIDNMIGTMVGLQWLYNAAKIKLDFTNGTEVSNRSAAAAPGLGFIRWARESKAGEQRIGIEFFPPDFKLAKAVMLGGSRELDSKRNWPVLIKPGKGSHTAIFPEANIYRNMTFMILQGDNHAHFRIKSVTLAGSNYTQCEIIHAKTA